MHCNWVTKEEKLITDFLPVKQPVKILITSGASCPDAVVEEVIERLVSFYPVITSVDKLTESFV